MNDSCLDSISASPFRVLALVMLRLLPLLYLLLGAWIVNANDFAGANSYFLFACDVSLLRVLMKCNRMSDVREYRNRIELQSSMLCRVQT